MIRAEKVTEKQITITHGAGGELMYELIKERILKVIKKDNVGGIGLKELDDGATIPLDEAAEGRFQSLVLTTDSHVVKPIFFPGGDIGRLAVSGTINDLAVMGARPLALTSSLIIEEGFSLEDFDKVMASMARTLEEASVALITGDTKVMEHGSLDGIVINTTGIGFADQVISDAGLHAGDKIIITGSIGDHGMAILAHRHNFETELVSDVMPLSDLIAEALKGGGITAMKDPTRGGLANALNDMARKANVGIIVEEAKIPIKPEVRGISELLGISPLEVANEGKAIIGVKEDKAEEVLKSLRRHPKGKDAAIIGEATEEYIGKVIMRTIVGGRRFLEAPLGDPVPRIC